MKRVLATFVSLFALFLFSGTVLGNNIPPGMNNSYFGDANGDMVLDTTDVNQMNYWILALPYTYDTIQPANSNQDWNTGDVTSDNNIDTSDVNFVNYWILALPFTITDKPWEITRETLPTSIASATPTAFQVSLNSNQFAQKWGRPGFPIIATIDPSSTATGSLGGRTCTPIAGSRDQAALAGAQCALSVTVSDWLGAPGQTKGLTETGTYGLSVTGTTAGNLHIVFAISGNPAAFDLPAITVGYDVTVTGGPLNQPPTWATTPSNITAVPIGSTYGPTTDGTVTDADTGETLTCSSNGTSCTFTPVVSGSGTKPVNCQVSFTANLTAQTCNLRIVATDNGSPAMSVGYNQHNDSKQQADMEHSAVEYHGSAPWLDLWPDG